MNESNLVSLAERTTEEKREIGIKGGIASGEARRKKKAMKEQIELLLSLPLKDKKAIKQLEALGIDTENIDNQMAMVISMWQQSIKGGKGAVEAAKFLRDTAGENPSVKVDVNDVTNKKFDEICSQLGGDGLDDE